MTSDELIQELVSELRPVRPLPGVGWRTLLWVGFALAVAALFSSVAGHRPDLASKLGDAAYLREAAALFLAFVLSARGAFHLSVPGAELRALARAAPVFAWLLWVAAIVARDAPASASEIAASAASLAGVGCVVRMGLLALAPAVVAFIMLRRAAPLRPGSTGLFALLAAGSLAILGTRAICSNDGAVHLLVWHLAPALLAGLAGLGLGRLLLGRARRPGR